MKILFEILMGSGIFLMLLAISRYIYYFIKEKLKKNKMEYINDVAINCLKDNELIAIISDENKNNKVREIADREARRRKLKIQI